MEVEILGITGHFLTTDGIQESDFVTTHECRTARKYMVNQFTYSFTISSWQGKRVAGDGRVGWNCLSRHLVLFCFFVQLRETRFTWSPGTNSNSRDGIRYAVKTSAKGFSVEGLAIRVGVC